MKAERIQDAPVLIPEWDLNSAITVQRTAQFSDFEAACRFVGRFSKWLGTESAMPTPEVEVRQGQVIIRLIASPTAGIDAKVDLIDQASYIDNILQQLSVEPNPAQ